MKMVTLGPVKLAANPSSRAVPPQPRAPPLVGGGASWDLGIGWYLPLKTVLYSSLHHPPLASHVSQIKASVHSPHLEGVAPRPLFRLSWLSPPPVRLTLS